MVRKFRGVNLRGIGEIMKVKFFVWSEESDVYEFPDDTTNEELETAASDWVADNISAAGYEIVLDDEDEI